MSGLHGCPAGGVYATLVRRQLMPGTARSGNGGLPGNGNGSGSGASSALVPDTLDGEGEVDSATELGAIMAL